MEFDVRKRMAEQFWQYHPPFVCDKDFKFRPEVAIVLYVSIELYVRNMMLVSSNRSDLPIVRDKGLK